MWEKLLLDLKNPREKQDFENWVKDNSDAVKRMHAHTAGKALLIVTGLIDLVYLVVGTQNKWLTAAAMICFVIYLLLPICFPVYFSIVPPERSHDHRRRALRYPLGAGLMLHGIVLSIKTISDFWFLSWLKLLLLTVMCAFLTTGVMILLAKEFRVKDQLRLGFLVIMLMISYGIVGQLNYLLDFTPPRTELTEITEVDFFSGWRGKHSALDEFTRYTCTVELEDGSEAIFTVPSYQTDGMWGGNNIAVEYHEGGLGLDYAAIRTVPDLEPR